MYREKKREKGKGKEENKMKKKETQKTFLRVDFRRKTQVIKLRSDSVTHLIG